MGRGSSKAGGGGAKLPAVQTVKDNYGRDVKIVSVGDIPNNLDVWPSGSFTATNGDRYDHYVVFASINGYNVDTNTLTGIKVSLNDLSGIKDIAGWQSWKTSKQADAYVKKYDKPGASAITQRRIQRAKNFSSVMKNLFGR